MKKHDPEAPRKLKIWTRIAILSGIIAFISIMCYLFGYTHFFTSENDENFYFTAQLVLHIVSILIILAVIQYYSIWKVNTLAEAKTNGKDEPVTGPNTKPDKDAKSNDKKEGEVPSIKAKCKYCHHPTTNLVCPECDSIQWEKDQLKSYIYVFLAHHRWNVIRTTLIFFLVGPMIYLLNVHFQRIEKIEALFSANNQDIEEVIALSNKIRPKIFKLREMAEEGTIFSDYDQVLIEQNNLIEDYFDYAWKFAKVIDIIRHIDSNEISNREKPAYRFLTTPNLSTTIDDQFLYTLKFINLSHRVKTDKYLDEKLLNKSYEYLHDLHTLTKAVSCAIGELSFNKGIRSYDHPYCPEEEIIDGCFSTIASAKDTVLIIVRKEEYMNWVVEKKNNASRMNSYK